ncbi:MAG: phosphate ABC transporter substrate-binding protein [Alphaproteobacteria bacterium]|nr:phosphate ABC transporter substrate-binding protein [Alphaproteobacteria bacterium]
MAIASLPMYDLPEARAATDAWWAGLARAFRKEGVADVPTDLVHDGHYHEPWRAPDLLFSQTCGYPLIFDFADVLRPLATPCYAVPDAVGYTYYSHLIIRADDPAQGLEAFRGRVAAINNWDSQSGMSALRHALAPHARGGRFFASVTETGGHRASMAAIVAGAADIAAVDCVTFAMVGRHTPRALDGLRILGRSARVPGLPYVCPRSASADLVRRLRAGIAHAMVDPSLAEARDALLITGAVNVEREDYAGIGSLEREAAEAGYPTLA